MTWQIIKWVLWGIVPSAPIFGLYLVVKIPGITFGRFLLMLNMAVLIFAIWAAALSSYLFAQSDPRLAEAVVMASSLTGAIVFSIFLPIAGAIAFAEIEKENKK